jgi:hypothetical protein
MTTFRLQHPAYEAMRRELLHRYGSASCNCGTFTRQMAQRFPELTRVPGFYLAPGGASHGEHWWLEAPDGSIVDPTADQWPSCGTGTYVRYDPTKHLLPKGTCPYCGTSVMSRAGNHPCSLDCDEGLAEEYGMRLAGGPYDADMALTCDADIAKYGLPVPAAPI